MGGGLGLGFGDFISPFQLIDMILSYVGLVQVLWICTKRISYHYNPELRLDEAICTKGGALWEGWWVERDE